MQEKRIKVTEGLGAKNWKGELLWGAVGGREAAQGPGRGTNGVVDAGKVRGSQQAGEGKEQKLKDLLRIAQHAYARKIGMALNYFFSFPDE